MRLFHLERRRLRTIIAAIFLTLTSAAAKDTTGYTITTSDGVRLDATLALPDTGNPPDGFPAVVLIHGYGGDKDEQEMQLVSTYLTLVGYGCFTYSVRGQGSSGGLSTTMGPREAEDLLEVIRFLRMLPRINPEQLAVAGGSQGGIHAWIAATHNMPGVKAIASLVGPPSFSLDLFPQECIKQQLWAELNLSGVRYDPVRDRVHGFVVQDQYDSVLAFASSRNLENLLDSVRVPVIQALGWADMIFPANGGIRARQRLARRGIPVWSYLGTNGHGEPIQLGEYLFEISQMRSWFDRWLKNAPLEFAEVPYVVYADDGPDWPHHETTEWPPPPYSLLRLYLAGNKLQTAIPPTSAELPFTLTYDSSYTPSQGWNDGYGGTSFIRAFRSSPVQLLSDPLTDTLQLAGIPRATLRFRSFASRVQTHIRLFDVTPLDTGYTWRLLTRGTNGVRANVAGSDLTREFECQALAHAVPPGHRIGIEVSSLDMYDTVRAHIIPFFRSSASVALTSPDAPSYVDLPVVGGIRFSAVPIASEEQPSQILLHQNYPNPFNPNTTIAFTIGGLHSVPVELCVYDVLGRTVSVLVSGSLKPGSYAAAFDGSRLASGMYIVRLTAGSGSTERKMVLLR